MWYPVVNVSEPADSPVSLDEACRQVRIFTTDTDNVAALSDRIPAAVSHIESYCGTALSPRPVVARCDSFADFAHLDFGPVQSVTAIRYVDEAGAEQTLDEAAYEVRAEGLEASIVIAPGAAWPAIRSGSRITVEATIGYAVLPAAVKMAVLLVIGDLFLFRETAATGAAYAIPVAGTVDNLLTNHRIYG